MSATKATSASLTRRATLKGAGVAVGTLWIAPVVQVISMQSAAAASSPPSRVQAGSTGGGPAYADGALPKTGADATVALGAAGAAAVAVGAAAVVAARRAGSRPQPEAETDAA